MRLLRLSAVPLVASLALTTACRSGAPETPVGTAVPGEHVPGAQTISATFLCAGGRQIQALFINGAQPSVSLRLGDGRHLDLPQAKSASGARYANDDESVVFWNTGRSAFLEEKGQRSYADCQQSR